MDVIECIGCSLQRVSLYPSEEVLARFYAEYARHYCQGEGRLLRVDVPPPGWVQERAVAQRRFIEEHVSDAALRGVIVEVGAGWGALSATFATPRTPQNTLIVYELDPESVDYIRRRTLADVPARRVQILDQTLTVEGYRASGAPPADVILSSHSLEHVSDPVAALRRWCAVASEGALVFVEVPREAPVPLGWGPDEHDPYFAGHLTFYEASTLARTLSSAGLELLAIEEDVGPMNPCLMSVPEGPTFDGGSRTIRALARVL